MSTFTTTPMMMQSAESVLRGHPDKVCDALADLILDTYLHHDPTSRVAVEVAIKWQKVRVFGEVSSSYQANIDKIVRPQLAKLWYTAERGYDPTQRDIMTTISQQSPEIGIGADHGAGDQGSMFGYATATTDTYLPAPIHYAHLLAKNLDTLRATYPYLWPDGKTQVSMNTHTNHITAVVISVQHATGYLEQVQELLTKELIRPTIGHLIDNTTNVYINPAGSFTLWGSLADAGLTGRKLMVDTYGGIGRHGGGACSGKDPTKVDRSGAYAARYIAKNIVAAWYATTCEVQLSYAIGKAEPVSIGIETYGTHTMPIHQIEQLIYERFPLRPYDIIEHFQLQRPLYYPTSAYGHMWPPDFPWEQLST